MIKVQNNHRGNPLKLKSSEECLIPRSPIQKSPGVGVDALPQPRE